MSLLLVRRFGGFKVRLALEGERTVPFYRSLGFPPEAVPGGTTFVFVLIARERERRVERGDMGYTHSPVSSI